MVGAVGVALAIEYDRSGVFTFLVPGAIGILLLVGAWVSQILLRIGENKKDFFSKYVNFVF